MVNKISGTQSDILKPSNDVEIGLIGACANKWEASAKIEKMKHFGFLKNPSKEAEQIFQKIFSWVKKLVEPKVTSLSLPKNLEFCESKHLTENGKYQKILKK